jgi:hypothetical protein
VFLVRSDGRARVVTSAASANLHDISFATQSGPMLVIDGELHPVSILTAHRATSATQSASVRTASLIIATDVSRSANWHFFRDRLKAGNASLSRRVGQFRCWSANGQWAISSLGPADRGLHGSAQTVNSNTSGRITRPSSR